MNNRLIVLTDIANGAEKDDIASMVRLLLYSNEIDIEGLIATTSCWYKKEAKENNKRIILNLIDAYEKVKNNLDIHSLSYPHAEYLRNRTFCGIAKFGKNLGDGFGEVDFNDNDGVNCIIEAADKEDVRPLWISLWGGANTLAQAVWKVSTTRGKDDLERFLAKLRIYGISDQDYAGQWLRDNFGDKLFYIVSPSPGEESKHYRRATWPGISADKFAHGSPDGMKGKGFKGAEKELISKRWLRKHIVSHGILGKEYPLYRFIMEGDTPSYLNLIPNGLNYPEHPNYGGWGGRYEYYIPKKEYTATNEKYPIWTNASDTVIGNNHIKYCSPQATIWRWREAFQNDFAARMDWTMTDNYKHANHPPIVKLNHPDRMKVIEGQKVLLNAFGSYDPDGDSLEYTWMYYKEAGTFSGDVSIMDCNSETAYFIAPKVNEEAEIHIILSVRDKGTPALTRYHRVIVTVNGN